MTAISKLQFSPFRANFCRGWAKPLICHDLICHDLICHDIQSRAYKSVYGLKILKYRLNTDPNFQKIQTIYGLYTLLKFILRNRRKPNVTKNECN